MIRFLLLTVFLLTSCATKFVVKSPSEVVNMTSKVYDENFDVVFRSIIVLLQSESYFIDKLDKENGLITAYRRIENKNRAGDVELFGYSVDAELSKIMFYVESQNKTSTDVRITLYEGFEKTIKKGESYYKESNEKMTNKPEIYTSIFNRLEAEIQRRNSLNK